MKQFLNVLVIDKKVHTGPVPSTLQAHNDAPSTLQVPTDASSTLQIPGNVPSTLEVPSLPRNRSFNTLKQEFNLWDAADFIKVGMEVS